MFAKIITILVILLFVAGAIDIRRIKTETRVKVQEIDSLAKNTAELAILDMESSGETPQWNKSSFDRKIKRKEKIYLLFNETTMTRNEIDQKMQMVDEGIIRDLEYQLEFELRSSNLLVEYSDQDGKEIIEKIHQLLEESDFEKLREYLSSKNLYQSNLKEIIDSMQMIKKKG